LQALESANSQNASCHRHRAAGALQYPSSGYAVIEVGAIARDHARLRRPPLDTPSRNVFQNRRNKTRMSEVLQSSTSDFAWTSAQRIGHQMRLHISLIAQQLLKFLVSKSNTNDKRGFAKQCAF
jgi:hypothetical protein